MSAPWALSRVVASLVALAPVAGAGDLAEALRLERKAAYRRGEFARVLGLVRRELAALEPEPGALRRRCDALEVGVIVCSERLPELACDDEFIRRAEAAGCLDDPRERARQHKLIAGAAFRRAQFAAALRASQRAFEAASPLLFASLLRADPAGGEQLRDVILDLAGVAALRVEIAAQLRSRAGFEAALATLTLFLDVLERDPATRSDAAVMRNEIAWGLLVLHEAGVELGDPTPLLASALEVFTAEPTRNVAQADNVRINLALAALQRGAGDEAARRLDEIEGAGLSVEERLWLSIARLRVALARGDLRQAARWQSELERPELREHAPMGAWFAAWTRGLLYEARGERAAASAAYYDAEAELEAHARGGEALAHGSSADRRYLMFSGAARRLVELRIAEGDVEAALRVARDARNRALRVHARGACARAADTPPDLPPPGALHLLYFPRDQLSSARPSAWYGFAATAAGVRVAALTLDPLPDDRLSPAALRRWSDLLLAPFEPELTEADELTVLAAGPLHALPLHALPWDGDILLAAVPVQYSLDIAPCGEAPRDRLERALVASGSDYSLPLEGHAVADLLRARGVAVDHWRVGAPRPLSAALTNRYELAHLAAHGLHPADEVMFTADVQLVFGDSGELTRESILALNSAPSLVYLSACRSSFADSETLGGGLNLAHAFLLRGARHVIGSVRDIDATATRSFAANFYRQLESVDPGDVAHAWQAAYLDTRASLAPSLQPDLRMLRLYTP